MARTVFPHKDLRKSSFEFVAVIAHSNPDHGEGDFNFGGKKTRLCNLYDLPSCKVHEDMRSQIEEKNLLEGVRGTPTHIIYTPGLEEVSRANYMSVSDIQDAVKEAQEKIGKPVRWKEYSKLYQAVTGARALVEKGDYRGALKALKGFEAKGLKSLQTQAEGLMEKILDAGKERIEEARTALEADDKEKATKILRGVIKSFAGTELIEEAKKLLAKAKEE